jgi:hypothetical protein
MARPPALALIPNGCLVRIGSVARRRQTGRVIKLRNSGMTIPNRARLGLEGSTLSLYFGLSMGHLRRPQILINKGSQEKPPDFARKVRLPLPDRLAVAIGLAQQDRGRRVAVGDVFDVHEHESKQIGE